MTKSLPILPILHVLAAVLTVHLFGFATASSLGVLGSPWLIASRPGSTTSS